MTKRTADNLVTFQSRAYNDVVMFGDVGKTLLGMMGMRENLPGALHPDDIPLASHNLRKALGTIAARDDGADAGEDADTDNDAAVPLADRALPLIELLCAAHRERAHVMWDRG